jgi:hypothetical protein
MTNRYPLVVNATTNQITEVQSGDDLLLDNTDLTTSSGDLVLDPAGDVDIKADLKNTADPNLKVDDDLYVTGTVGIGVAPIGNSDITINRTWNNSATTFFGTNIDITDTNSNANSRLLRLAVGNVTKFDVDVDGDTNIYGTTTLHGVTNVNIGIVPDTDEGAYIGTTTKPFSEAHIDEIRIGVSGDTEIDTATGGLTLDSATGETTVDDNLTVSGNLDIGNTAAYYTGISNQTLTLGNATRRITLDGTNGNITTTGTLDATGNLVVDGNSTLGDANTDDCAINARVTTSVVPKTDSQSDLGTTALRWRNLFVDDITVTTGISVSTLKALDGTTALTLANTTGDVTVAGDLQITGNEIKSSTGSTAITLSGSDVTIAGNLTVDGTQTIINTSTLSVEDATIELRRGNDLTAATGGIQVNQTTNSSGVVQTYQQLVYDSTATKWRTYDGTTYKSLVNETDATTLGKITLNGGVVENFDDASAVGNGGIVTLDQNSSNIHLHTNPGGDFSFRVTNVPTTNLYATTVLLIIKQELTPGKPTTLYINGTNVSTAALGLSNFDKGSDGETDVYSFQLLRQNNAWHILSTRTNFA